MAIEEVILINLDDAPLTEGADAADSLADALADVDRAAEGISLAKGSLTAPLDASAAAAKRAQGAIAGAAKATNALSPAKVSAVGKAFDTLKAGAKRAGSAIGATLKEIGKGALRSIGELGLKGLEGAFEKFLQVAKGADEMKRSLDQVTRGRGNEAFAHLSEVAKGINRPVAAVTDQFIALRKQGLDNLNATKAIKLQADLEAVGLSSEDAQAQVQEFAKALAKGENADAAISRIAKAYGAAGDGSDAAAKGANTTAGALEKLALIAEQSLGALIDEAGPQITAFAQALAKSFGEMDPQTMKDLAKGSVDLLKAITPLIPVMAKVAAWSISHLGRELSQMASGIGKLRSAFTALNSAGATVAGVINGAIAAVVGAVTSADAAVTGAMNAILAAIKGAVTGAAGAIGGIGGAISAGLSGAITRVSTFAGSFVGLGKSLIDGLVAGIKAGAKAAVAAVADVGSQVEGGLKSALGIGSPSKVAMALGANFSGSFADAAAIDLPAMTASLTAPAASGGSIPVRAGAQSISIVINVANSNASADDIALECEAAIRRAIA